MDDFFQEASTDADQMAYQADASAFTSAPDSGFGGGMPVTKAGHTAAPDTTALIEFNKRFRALGEEKEAKEREAKAARRAAGKSTLKKMLAERHAHVDARKNKNREDEKATERAMLDSLQGESWTRVVTMIDIHPAAHEKAENKGKAGEDAGTARMRDVLIGLKAKPLAA